MDSSKLHAVIVSSPGIGHVIPVLELGKKLAFNHGFHITVILITTNPKPPASHTQAQTQTSLPFSDLDLFHVIELPAADVTGVVSPDAAVLTRIVAMMRETLPAVRSTIAAMDNRPSVLIGDLFGTEILRLAGEFGIPKYVLVTINAWSLSLATYCQVLDKEVEGEFVDRVDPFEIPGCRSVRPEDLVDPMVDRKDPQYQDYMEMGIGFTTADGILLNTWEDLEPRTLTALRENEILRKVVKAPVYPIGPLVRRIGSTRSSNELMGWLDEQPNESVLYVSFGSGGTMSSKQITELAWGLELSQQRFVWVVRRPAEKDSDGSYFASRNGSDGAAKNFLPDGFLTRTRNRGMVVSQWAPQLEVLSHPSVGGFMSHCGWNSTLESIVNGVPMIAWPLYAEQKLNATALVEELGVAVRPKVLPTKEVVERGEIERMVRRVMEDREGEVMRARVRELMASGEEALSKGGSSYNSMCDMINDLEMRLQ